MQLLELFSDWEDQVSFPRGAIVFRNGEDADFLYVVTEGEVELRIGEEPLAAEMTGGIFGEMALVEAKRSADAVTIRPSRLARINRDQFRELVQQNPDLAIHLIAVVANRLRVAVALAKL